MLGAADATLGTLRKPITVTSAAAAAVDAAAGLLDIVLLRGRKVS
jgi:hypothetical protein